MVTSLRDVILEEVTWLRACLEANWFPLQSRTTSTSACLGLVNTLLALAAPYTLSAGFNCRVLMLTKRYKDWIWTVNVCLHSALGYCFIFLHGVHMYSKISKLRSRTARSVIMCALMTISHCRDTVNSLASVVDPACLCLKFWDKWSL